MNPLTALLAITASVAVVRPTQQPFWIGFVNHYPMVRNADERMAVIGANVCMLRAPWSLIEPAEGEFDFRIIDDQLDMAWHQGIRVIVLIEAGPAHASAVPWLMDKLRAAGETQVDIDGKPWKDPSIFSPIYRTYLARYARAVALHIVRHKRARVVLGYSNGCEWWWPMGYAYGELAQAAFRTFLKDRYGSLEQLTERWGATSKEWESISAPRLDWVGSNASSQSFMLPRSAQLDACYCTLAESHVPVAEGTPYTFRVEWSGVGIRAGGVTAEIAWLGADSSQPIGIATSPLVQSNTRAEVTATAPKGATRAWLLAKSRAVGTVRFTSVSFRSGSGPELAPNRSLDPEQGAWSFVQWSAGESTGVSHRWVGPGDAEIAYASSMRLDTPAKYPLAAVSDWCEFRARAMGNFIDKLAADIRSVDPARPIFSYLTFAFANAFEWDYAQQMAIQLEHWAPAARNQQVLGMQLASGEGDTASVTCALDLVRKYGKPMWAVDLLDFTRGTDLGVAGTNRLSQDVVRHGGTGILYYCWWGTPHYNYLDFGESALKDIVSSTRAFAARRKPLTPSVALVMPRMPLYGTLQTPANDWADFMGWYKLLLRSGVTPDVYALDELKRPDLRRHRVIIVPDCAYISGTSLDVLQATVRKGTRLVVSGRFAQRDMTGRIHAKREAPAAFRRFAYPIGARVLGETHRHPTPTDTPPRLVCRPGSPAWNAAPARLALATIRDALRSPTHVRKTSTVKEK